MKAQSTDCSSTIDGANRLRIRSIHKQTRRCKTSLKNFASTIEVAIAMRPLENRRPVLKMVQDEGRFGHISPKRAWAPPGIRPKAPRRVIRQSIYVYTAVASEQQLVTSLVVPSADTSMMNLFLAHAANVFADHFILMQLDQAGWHVSRQLHIPKNSRLIFRPAYSPEVNPVEHLRRGLPPYMIRVSDRCHVWVLPKTQG
jgi:hypothetical protein